GGAMGGLAGRMLGGRGGLPGSLGALSAMGSTGDILKAMFGQLGGQMDKFVYGDKGPEARAAMRAQDDIVKSMALATGLSGSIPPAAKDIFDARRQIFEAEEKGAQMIRTSKDFNPESINSKVEAIIERGVTSFVGRLFGYMAGNTFNSK
ncbi:hypothetical protein KDA14_04935, partial [Candidatus Saccharibacteria bacterium]|nr:hypothetical protein [Candidatus Saccharibacteria bacterium]